MLFLFLDCETTSLNFDNGQIIELAGTLCSFSSTKLPVSLSIPSPNFPSDIDPKNEMKSTILTNNDQQKNDELATITSYFQTISEFGTLVRLRSELDKKTVRITGIDQNMLRDAPKMEMAMEKWQNWLEEELAKWQKGQDKQNSTEAIWKENSPKKDMVEVEKKTKKRFEIVGKEVEKLFIVGHSLDFDLGFLRYEKWFLPDFIKIDTLELAKIFLPEVEAVNLEFLTKKLNLTPSVAEFENLKESETDTENQMKNTELKPNFDLTEKSNEENSPKNEISFHRALFDAKCCQNLLEFLLTKISQNSLPEKVESLFNQKLARFLPVEIILELTQNSNDQRGKKTEKEMESDTRIFPNQENCQKKPQTSLEQKQSKMDLEDIQDEITQEETVQSEIKFDLEGEVLIDMEQKLSAWSQRQTWKSLAQILDQSLPKDLDLLILQLVWIALESKKVPQKMKLHTQKEYLIIADLFLV
jgi:DNA polymerase III epsilon subunit-like protein